MTFLVRFGRHRTWHIPWDSIGRRGGRARGLRGTAVPPLKAGSGLNIPCPPAVLLPSGRVVTPTIEVAERLQGFPSGWTSVLRACGAERDRWRLIGNAVSVPDRSVDSGNGCWSLGA